MPCAPTMSPSPYSFHAQPLLHLKSSRLWKRSLSYQSVSPWKSGPVCSGSRRCTLKTQTNARLPATRGPVRGRGGPGGGGAAERRGPPVRSSNPFLGRRAPWQAAGSAGAAPPGPWRDRRARPRAPPRVRSLAATPGGGERSPSSPPAGHLAHASRASPRYELPRYELSRCSMLRAAAGLGPRLGRRLLSAAATHAVPAPNQQPEVFYNKVRPALRFPPGTEPLGGKACGLSLPTWASRSLPRLVLAHTFPSLAESISAPWLPLTVPRPFSSCYFGL